MGGWARVASGREGLAVKVADGGDGDMRSE
jgi:hypothetical protein